MEQLFEDLSSTVIDDSTMVQQHQIACDKLRRAINGNWTRASAAPQPSFFVDDDAYAHIIIKSVQDDPRFAKYCEQRESDNDANRAIERNPFN